MKASPKKFIFTAIAACVLSASGVASAQTPLVVYDFEFGVDYSGYSPVGYVDDCVAATPLYNSDNETISQGWRCFQNWGSVDFTTKFDDFASGSLTSLCFDYSQFFETTTANPITGMELEISDGSTSWSVGSLALDPDLRSERSYGDNSANVCFDLSSVSIKGGESLTFTLIGTDDTPFVRDFNGLIMDNVTLNGDISCVPEPSSMLFVVMAGLVGIMRRKRR